MNVMRKHRTPNIEHPTSKETPGGGTLDVRCSMFDVRCFGSSSRMWVVAMLFVFPFLTRPLSAQTNAPRASTSRYLFIVDTSAAMRRCAPAAQKAIGSLVHSGLGRQLRVGDTVGVWTFDEELHAGRFPLQQWSPERNAAVASNVLAFLQAQRFQKQSR